MFEQAARRRSPAIASFASTSCSRPRTRSVGAMARDQRQIENRVIDAKPRHLRCARNALLHSAYERLISAILTRTRSTSSNARPALGPALRGHGFEVRRPASQCRSPRGRAERHREVTLELRRGANTIIATRAATCLLPESPRWAREHGVHAEDRNRGLGCTVLGDHRELLLHPCRASRALAPAIRCRACSASAPPSNR